MGSDRTDLQREFFFEVPDLDEQIDDIIDRVNGNAQRIEEPDADAVTFVNTTGVGLEPGTLLGFASDGSLALADASNPIIKASLVCPELTAINGSFTPVFGGVTEVRVASAVTIQRVGFLSTTAGEAQPSNPVKPDHTQQIGVWIEARKTDTSRAKMILLFDTTSARRNS